MPIAGKYLFIVSMDVAKEKEALFNEVYDKEHVPLLSKVPGVRGVTRMKTEPAAFNIARPAQGARWRRRADLHGDLRARQPRRAFEQGMGGGRREGALAAEVRPFTTNRHHIVRKVI